MKFCHIRILSIFSLALVGLIACDKNIGQSNIDHLSVTTTITSLIDRKGVVSDSLAKLLTVSQIEHDGSLSDIVKKTQEKWLRKPGTERWHIKHDQDNNDTSTWKLFDEIGLISQVNPEKKLYDDLVILGALFDTMKNRIEYAIDLWNQGIRFKHVVLLGSSRPACAEQSEVESAFKAYVAGDQTVLDYDLKTEAEMLKFLWDYAPAMPSEMKKIPVLLIDVAMLPKADGTLRRANTADTIQAWISNLKMQERMQKAKNQDQKISVLCVSNQPYVAYQNSVVKTELPKVFMVETVGKKMNDKEDRIAVLFDTLARILYQEQQRIVKILDNKVA